jgi:O-antigen ligase
MTSSAAQPQSVRVGLWIYWASVFTLFGIALANVLLGLSLLLALWLVASHQRGRLRWPGAGRSVGFAIAAYALCEVISGVLSLDPWRSFEAVGSDLFTLTSLPLAVYWARSTRDVERLTHAVLGLAAWASIYGIGQTLVHGFGDLQQRSASIFSHYMTYSGILVIALCLALGRWVVKELAHRWLSGALVGLYSVALLLTLTRGAWIAALAAGAAVMILRARRAIPLVAAATVAAGLLLAQCAPEYWDRARSITRVEDASNYDRLCMLWSGAQIVRDRPVFGLGPALLPRYYPVYRHPTAPRDTVQHLHNSYAHLAAEEGLVTLAVYIALLVMSFGLGWRLLRRVGAARPPPPGPDDATETQEPPAAAWDPAAEAVLFGTLLALATFSFAGLFEANWRDTEIERIVLMLLAVPVCFAGILARRKDPEQGVEIEADATTAGE